MPVQYGGGGSDISWSVPHSCPLIGPHWLGKLLTASERNLRLLEITSTFSNTLNVQPFVGFPACSSQEIHRVNDCKSYFCYTCDTPYALVSRELPYVLVYAFVGKSGLVSEMYSGSVSGIISSPQFVQFYKSIVALQLTRM